MTIYSKTWDPIRKGKANRDEIYCKPHHPLIDREFLAEYFDLYLQKTKDDWNYILPKQLYQLIDKGNPPCFLLDVRKHQDYLKGHIHGSVNIFWLDLFKKKNLSKLPKTTDCLIVIICYLGHTASQVLTLLKLMGYNAVVLKFGMGISPIKGIPIAGWKQLGYPTEI